MAMRASISVLVMGMAGIWLASCAGPAAGGAGKPGDLGGGGDPEEGGISEVPNPHPAMAAKSGKSLALLQRGHEVYMLKCAECHAYKLPRNIDMGRWTAGRLKIDCSSDLGSAQVQAVVDYVSAVKLP